MKKFPNFSKSLIMPALKSAEYHSADVYLKPKLSLTSVYSEISLTLVVRYFFKIQA